ncbi:MAG: hypothetical protein ACLVJ6_09240 [Merdibacter sp.]
MKMVALPIVNECHPTATMVRYRHGIRAGIWAGAKMDTTDAPMILTVVWSRQRQGCYVDDGQGNLAFQSAHHLTPAQPHLKVNKEGFRFANESVRMIFNHAAFANRRRLCGDYGCQYHRRDPGLRSIRLRSDSVNIAKNGIVPTIESYVELA